MSNKSLEKTGFAIEPVSEEPGMDGLLREFAENGAEPDHELVSRIMSEARSISKTEAEEAEKGPVLSLLKYLLPLAASLAIAGLLIFRDNQRHTPSVSTKRLADSALLIASTPGGIIERNSEALAISNGMKVSGNDRIKTYKSSIAYLQFNDLSRLKISGDSDVIYRGTELIKNPDRSCAKKVNILLRKGAIYGDIVKDHGFFVVETPYGRISITQGKFLLVSQNDSCYLEVLRGKLKFKSRHGDKVTMIRKGKFCIVRPNRSLQVAELNNLPSETLHRQIKHYRQALPLNDGGFEELILKLYQKRKADICLQRNPKRNQKIFL